MTEQTETLTATITTEVDSPRHTKQVAFEDIEAAVDAIYEAEGNKGFVVSDVYIGIDPATTSPSRATLTIAYATRPAAEDELILIADLQEPTGSLDDPETPEETARWAVDYGAAEPIAAEAGL